MHFKIAGSLRPLRTQAEQLEYRTDGDEDIFAWDFDAFYGTDELRLVWRSEAEHDLDEEEFETLENQARLQKPISDLFDGVVGIRVDPPAPKCERSLTLPPNRCL